MGNGTFIISLDFELLWGVRDKRTINSYGINIEGVRTSLPKTLLLFKEYNIKATFATVGFLFAKTKEELIEHIPNQTPSYLNSNLSPYKGHFETIQNSEQEDPYHFAGSLLDLIKQYPEHEIATHTFSHYYCLEEGQTVKEFEADMKASISIAKKIGVDLRSLIFPRNQFNEAYLNVCSELGITSFRGNENASFYRAVDGAGDTLPKKILRMIDTYINISGHNVSEIDTISKKRPLNIPSSRFLRPYNPKLRLFENLRLRRIKRSMTYAARKGKVFHLWWHPHNFGINQRFNFYMLEAILRHYRKLNRTYNFESLTMECLSERLIKDN